MEDIRRVRINAKQVKTTLMLTVGCKNVSQEIYNKMSVDLKMWIFTQILKVAQEPLNIIVY